MPALALPDPPLSDGVVTLRGLDSSDVAAIVAVGFAPVDAPVVHRPECDQLPDAFFARPRT